MSIWGAESKPMVEDPAEPTQSAYAWSLDDGTVDDYTTQRLTPRRACAAAVTVSLVDIVGVAAFAGYTFFASKRTTATATAPGQASAQDRIAQAPPLDGTYRV